MAAYTSSGAGNWSSASTWGGAGVPGIGDTATVNHAVTVDANTTVGTSGAFGTIVITVGSAGSLTIATGIRLTVRGDTQLQNSVLTLAAGAIYEFDSSVAAGTPLYKIQIGSVGSQQNSKLVCNGTSGSRCTIRKASGSGNGLIGRFTNAGTAWTQARCVYTDFSDLGTAAYGYDTSAIQMNLNHSAAAEGYFDHCTFTRCGTIEYVATAAARDMVFTFNRMDDSIATQFAIWLTATASTTGLRTVTDNVFPCTAYVATAAGKEVILSGSLKGLTFARNIAHRYRASSITENSAPTQWQYNVIICRGTGSASNTMLTGLGGINATFSDSYLFSTAPTGDPIGIDSPAGSLSGTMTYAGFIFDFDGPNEDGDFIHYGTPTAAQTLIYERNLSIPNSRGRSSGSINGHGNKWHTIRLRHNTVMSADNTSPSVTGLVGFWTGSGYVNHVGMYDELRDNLVWSKTVRATGSGNLIAHHKNSGGPFTGNATAGSTTTQMNLSGTVPTTAGVSMAEAGAIVVITGKTGSGPPVGEVRTITANTASAITVGTAFSATPDTGTSYSIFSYDNLRIGGVLKNGHYNSGTGTVWDQNGANPTTLTGYDGFWQTNPSTLGSSDINLGTGTNEMTQGPKFRDTSRNLATFDRAYLGNTSVTAWSSGASFVVGDIRSNSNASYYNGTVVNFRAIAAHAGNTANSEPGVGSAWRTYWEIASVQRLRDAVIAGTKITDATLGLTNASYPEVLIAWVRAGFAPSNTALKGTASDGGDIGAVAAFSAASISTISPSSGVQGTAPTVTIAGSNTSFSGSSVITISGSGVTISGTSAGSATSISATFTIAAGAATGSRTVTVTTGSEVVTTSFSVGAAPAITGISPSSAVQGTAPTVTITGSNTNFSGASVITVSGTGVTVSGTSATSATSISATFTIAAGATVGSRTVTVTTGGEVVTTSFSITATPAGASITINPGSAEQGTAPITTITGTNTTFSGATTVSVSGTGVTATIVSVVSATNLSVMMSAASDATVGSRTVTVTTGAEVATTSFSITAAVSPDTGGMQGVDHTLADFGGAGNYVYEELTADETVCVSATVAAGQGVLLRGQVLGKNAISGKWAANESPLGVLAHDIDATDAEATAVICVQGKVKDNAIVLGTGLTLPQARAALADVGVYLLDVQE